MAALTANLLEAYRRSVNLSEGYSYAKARENQILNDARANTDGLVAGTAAELLGGSVAGGGLGRAGFTTSRMLSSQPGLVGRTLTSAADTAGLGGIAGFTVVYTAVADKLIRNIWGK